MAIRPFNLSDATVSRTPLARAIALGKAPMGFAALFSFVSNMLYLALPIYTTQIYSRVLYSQSIPTLMVLTIGAIFVFAVSAVIDHYRAQVLAGFGVVFDSQLASLTFSALFDAVVRRHGNRSQALRDLDTIRYTITGHAIGVLFDLPWIPIFLIALFIADPTIGLVTTMGGVLLLFLAMMQERSTHHPLKTANEAAIQSYAFTDAALRNGDVVRALGMLPTLGRHWIRLRRRSVIAGVTAAETSDAYAGAIRFVRLLIQIVIIAMGAWLVIDRTITSGLLFANMILGARALAPIERAVGSWKMMFDGIQAYKRVDRILSEYEPPLPVTHLPRPIGHVSIEQVSFAPLGAQALVLSNLSLRIEPGEFVGVIGPSGAGKSTLARLLVGIWKPNAGAVRLDGADVYSWDREDFGRQVAYQPQDTELFAGTVRDNIARFRADATDEDVVKAAQAAGAHQMILRLANGYDTELHEGGAVLSSGQRQRVGLARTLFGEPKLVVLDEPNANLDSDGEHALVRAMADLKAKKTTVVLISHKPSILAQADKLLLLRPSQPFMYAEREVVLRALRDGSLQKAKAPPRAVSTADVES